MNESLIFRQLAVKHTPGFPQEGLPTMTFVDGVNIVYGPNASGKTTTARALQALLWPQSNHQLGPSVLSAEFSYRGQSGQIVSAGGAPHYTLPLPMPYLGDPSCAAHYMLAQHELLAANETGEDFARAILQEMRGGLDLEMAGQRLGYREPSRGSSTRELSSALQTFLAAKQSENQTRDDEAQLETLTQEQDAARQAQQVAGRLQSALDYFAAQSQVARCAETLERFPLELNLLGGNEANELSELCTAIATAEGQCAEAASEISEADAITVRTPLTDPAQVEIMSAALQGLSEKATRYEQQLAVKKSECQREKSEAQSAYTNLGGRDISAFANPLDASVVAALDQFVKSAEGLQTRDTELEGVDRWLESITPAEDQPRERLQLALKNLSRWQSLDAATPEVASPGWLPLAGILASALAVIAGVLVFVLNKAPLGGLGLLGGLLAFVFFVLLRGKPRSAGGPTRTELETQIAGFHLGVPTSWSAGEVDLFIAQLLKRMSAGDLRENFLAKRHELSLTRQTIQQQLDALTPEKVRIAGLLGIDPAQAYAGGNASLYFFVTQLVSWQKLVAAMQCTQAEIDSLAQELAGTFQQANALLRPVGGAEVSDNNVLQGMIRLLNERRNELLSAETVRRGAVQRQTEQAEQARKLMDKRAAFLLRLTLNDDVDEARRKLQAWLPLLADFNKARRACEDARAVAAERERQGRLLPGWETLMHSELAELQRQYDAATTLAERLAALSTEVGACQARIKVAKEQNACEEAQATLDRVLTKQRSDLDDALHAAVGWYLTQGLNQRELEHSQPEVFQRARQRFAEFTNGRYELQIEKNSREFLAADCENGGIRKLTQLSSGTRIHLLMAVRVAFVETREAAEGKLPLLLDETLAGSDPLREQAIISATLQICREGRQIFYFTSKPHEVELWKALAAQEEIPIRVIKLADTPDERLAPSRPNSMPVVPAPDGMSHAAYAEALRIPALDFSLLPVGGAHLWYVLQDDQRLYRLLKSGIATCGQLSNPALTNFLTLQIGEEALRHARALIGVLEEIETLWHEGRGLPLTLQALQETGILSTETFRTEIVALAERVHWEARALREALENKEVKHMREDRILKFVDDCEKKGYLVAGNPLSMESVQDILLAKNTELLQQQVVTVEEIHQLLDYVDGLSPYTEK
jgi:energy-coupling factor transporter ATP-binding protein EcfA2